MPELGTMPDTLETLAQGGVRVKLEPQDPDAQPAVDFPKEKKNKKGN